MGYRIFVSFLNLWLSYQPLSGLASLCYSKLFNNRFSKWLVNIKTWVSWHRGCFSVKFDFCMLAALFKNRALLSQPPLKLTLFHLPSFLFCLTVIK